MFIWNTLEACVSCLPLQVLFIHSMARILGANWKAYILVKQTFRNNNVGPYSIFSNWNNRNNDILNNNSAALYCKLSEVGNL